MPAGDRPSRSVHRGMGQPEMDPGGCGRGRATAAELGDEVGIGPVQILEHHDQRARPGEPPQQLQHRLAPHGQGVVTARAIAGGRDDRAERGQPRRQTGVVGETAIPQHLKQRFGQRPVRRTGARGHGPARGHRRRAGQGLAGHLAGQARLADARLAGEEHQGARAIICRGKCRLQHTGLRVPPHQNGAQRICHTASVPAGRALRAASGRCSAARVAASLAGRPLARQPGNTLRFTYRSASPEGAPGRAPR